MGAGAAEAWLWILFIVLIFSALGVDLGIFNRKAHAPSTKEAGTWTTAWILLALAFNAVVYLLLGKQLALEFLAGYLVEKSLSIDNIFVFLMLFTYFGVPAAYQHRVLFWGVLGAIVMRGIFVVAGAALFHTFDWVAYLFGAFLVYTGIRMAVEKEQSVEPEKNPIFRHVRRVLPLVPEYRGAAFVVREAGRLVATPLLLVLVAVELTDVLFAVDSVPAVFAVSPDPFIVYTSNIFAILGLRALYFLLAGMMGMFRYLRYGLSFVLSFVGVKMLVSGLYEVPISLSLAVIFLAVGVSVAASLVVRPAPAPEPEEEPRTA